MFVFPSELRKYMEDKLRAAQTETDLRKLRGGVRVDVKLLDGLRREAKSGNLTYYCDARKEVGGQGEHPGALQYFVSGLPFCQFSHYTERSALNGLRIESIEMSVRAYYDTRPEGCFEEIVYETRITSPEPEEKIKQLVKFAETDCYVTNTLSKAVKISREVYLNGKQIMKT